MRYTYGVQPKMNKNLKDIICRLKISLKEDPNGIIVGELNEGISGIQFEFNSVHLTQYISFLEKTNGARCGAIDFWTYEELPDNQFRVSEFPEFINRWLEIGQVVYKPLFIDKFSGSLILIEEEGRFQEFENLDTFLLSFVFGKNYQLIVPYVEKEEWFQFLIRNETMSFL